MRRKIIKIFAEPDLHEASGGALAVKEEVLYGQSSRTNDRGSSTRCSFRGASFRGRVY